MRNAAFSRAAGRAKASRSRSNDRDLVYLNHLDPRDIYIRRSELRLRNPDAISREADLTQKMFANCAIDPLIRIIHHRTHNFSDCAPANGFCYG